MINARFFDSLVGKHGLINSCFTRTPGRYFFPKGLNSYAAQSKNLRFSGCLVDEITTGGTAFSEEECIYATYGEFIERYLGAKVNFNALIKGSYTELTARGYACLHPDSVSLYADWQYKQANFPFEKLSVSDEVFWLEGKNYRTKETVLIPDFLVYWVHIPNRSKYYLLPTSNGFAAGENTQKAIQSGVLETFERQAFSEFWYKQKTDLPDTYTAEQILAAYEHEDIQRLYGNEQVTLKVFDLGKYVPVEAILVFMFFKYKGRNLYALGASARFDKKSALIKACIEAYQIAAYATEFGADELNYSEDYKEELKKLNNFEKHYHFYNVYEELRESSPAFRQALSPEATCKKVIHFEDKLTGLSALEKSQYDIFYVELSDQSLTGLPFAVTKVIMPEFVPITGNHNFPFLGHVAFGNKEDLFLELPHCFP